MSFNELIRAYIEDLVQDYSNLITQEGVTLTFLGNFDVSISILQYLIKLKLNRKMQNTYTDITMQNALLTFRRVLQNIDFV